MFPWRTRYPDVEIGYPGVLMLVSPQHIVAFEGFLTALLAPGSPAPPAELIQIDSMRL